MLTTKEPGNTGKMLTRRQIVKKIAGIKRANNPTGYCEVFENINQHFDFGLMTSEKVNEITNPLAHHTSTDLKIRFTNWELVSQDAVFTMVHEDKYGNTTLARSALRREDCSEVVLREIHSKAIEGSYDSEGWMILDIIKKHPNAPQWLIKEMEAADKTHEIKDLLDLYSPLLPWLVAGCMFAMVISYFFAVMMGS